MSTAYSPVDVSNVDIPFITKDAKVTRFDNGYTLVYVNKPGEVFNLNTWVRTGSIHEDDEINGISHFLEHLMFKGTERYKPGEFDKAMESMGAVINAATWKDFTFYYITGPQGKENENFYKALDMHADMMLHSTIPDAEVGPQYDPFDENYDGEKRERSVVIEEIGMREDQPWTKVYNSLNNMMYPEGHPYQRDVIGTRKIIGNIPRDVIHEYYRKWYSPQNMITVVVGDFDEKELEQNIARHFDFNNLPPSDGKAMSVIPSLGKFTKRYEEVPGEYQTSFFIQGFHGPKAKDLKESIALDVASQALGESRSCRFTQELVEKAETANFTFISTGQSTYKLGNVFYIQGNFTSDDVKGSLETVQGELVKMLTTHPVTQDELSRALKKMKVDFAETSETASGIAETIGESLTVVEDLDHYARYLDVLNTITLDDVNAVARKYLQPELMFTSVLVPKSWWTKM